MQLPPTPPSTPGGQPTPVPEPANEPSPLLFAVFCLLGSAIIGIMPLLGVAVLAFSAEVLFVHGRQTLTYVAAFCGALSCIIWGIGMVLTVFIIAGCTVFAAQFMSDKPAERWFVLVGAVEVCLLLALDTVFAESAGTHIWEVLGQQLEAQFDQMQSMQAFTATDTQQLANLRELTMSFWPVIYVIQGAMLTIIAVVVSALARRRIDANYAKVVKPFSRFDSSPHILWPLIIGLWCIATSYMVPDLSTYLTCAGAILIIIARILVGVQGAALVRSFQERMGFSTGMRVAVWIFAGLLDLALMAITLLGLLDIWTNFRRLEREDADPKGNAQKRNG